MSHAWLPSGAFQAPDRLGDGMLDDGVYALKFEGQTFDETIESDGLAILRGDRVVGSDRHGGVFRGRYRYDAAADCAVIDVRLAVPPNGVLLTGLDVGPDGAFLDVAVRVPLPNPVSHAVIDIAGVPVRVELRFMGPFSKKERRRP